MESGKISDSVLQEVVIPIDENGHGEDSEHSPASDTSLQQQEKKKASNECSPTFSTELLIRRPSARKSTFSSPKSRMMELEAQTRQSRGILLETNNKNSYPTNSVCSRAETLRSGSLPPARDHDDNKEEDLDDDDDDDDDDADENNENEIKTSGNHGGDVDDAKKILGKSLVGKVWKRGNIKVTMQVINAIIEWILFVSAMVMLISSLYVHELKIRMIWGLEIWKWCVLVAVFFCGRLVTKWARDGLVFLIESKYLFNEKVVYFVHGVKQSVQVVIWLSLILLSWFLLIERGGVKRSRKTNRILNYITRAFAATLIGAVLWMIKTLLVKLIAASFHVKTFFSKIRETISQEYVLWALSVPQTVPSAESGSSGLSTWWCIKILRWKVHRQNKRSSEITMKKLGKMRSGKIPVSTMGCLVDRIRSSKMSIISSALNDGGEQREIISKSDVEEAASQIFQNVKGPHLDYIEEVDLSPFKNKENEDCLHEWFEKVAEAGKINETELTNWAVNALKERENLSHSLKDAKTAIEELNRILCAVVLVLIVIVWLLLMGFATTKVLVFLSSQLLVAVFIFGNTCKNVFEAMIFVFIMHPFDVGDRCVIDGVMMAVEEMDILKTSFLRCDNEMIYYPNSVLASKVISNFNRSPEKMGDDVTFDIDVSTPSEVIQALRDRIKEHILKTPEHWHPDHSVQIMEIENMNKMKMGLFVIHKMNFQEYLEKMNRKTTLMLALKQIFEDLNIKYHLLPQEVQLTYYSATSSSSMSAPPALLEKNRT